MRTDGCSFCKDVLLWFSRRKLNYHRPNVNTLSEFLKNLGGLNSSDHSGHQDSEGFYRCIMANTGGYTASLFTCRVYLSL